MDEIENYIKEKKRISKTEAKKQFMLKDNDLEGLKSYQFTHEIYKNKLTYYNAKDLYYKAIQKYGLLEFEKKIEKREDCLLKNIIKRENEEANLELLIDSRKKELINQLKENNLEFREDSKICKDYIQNGNNAKYKVYDIVNIMRENKFLHEHTNYSVILENKRKQYKSKYSYNCVFFSNLTQTLHDFNFYELNHSEEEEIRDISKEKACINYIKAKKDINLMPITLQLKYNIFIK
jgi:hypothetical protein